MSGATLEAAVSELIAAGRWMAERGFVPATSGNLSARLDAQRILVTASGGDKGSLRREDLLELSLEHSVAARVSAETPLHVAIYRSRPDVGAVLHAHSRSATVLSRRLVREGRVLLDGYELVKAFRGVRTHEVAVEVPILANSQDVVALAAALPDRLRPEGGAPGFLLAGHGVYAWGQDITEARRHLEALDFLFECELLSARG